MLPEERNASYLWDMLDGARTVREFTVNVSFEQYLKDRKLQMAVERGIEIIGEAARRLSDSFRQEHSEIPWRNILAQRNLLVHEYGEIRQERLWIVVNRHIPELISQLEQLELPPPPPDPEPET